MTRSREHGKEWVGAGPVEAGGPVSTMPVFPIGEAAAVEVYATLAGATTELSRIVAATREARSRGEDAIWHVPVTETTVHRLEGLFRLAAELGARFELGSIAPLPAREQAFLDDFSKYLLKENPDARSGLTERVRVAAEVAEELVHALGATAELFTGKPPAIPKSIDRVVIIGAYGGDHVGDAAILGGVLFALHARYGVKTALLLSHRPEHTRRLVHGLKAPVTVRVFHYDAPRGRALMAEADALVVAGGPMMDLPRVLAKHLVVAAAARRENKPLLVERVGIGPFKRELSRRAARLLLRQASHVSTRTSKAAKDPILSGVDVSVSRDPAFDYLETRTTLDLLTPKESASVDALFAGTEGRTLIGINLRPIRHEWSVKGESYSADSEGRLIKTLADAMTRLAATRPTTFVFFPMNPIQFGHSDLDSAFRLRGAVSQDVDYRVWEADPDVDGILHCLRRLDLAVAMRFHACIFSLSQGLPVIGIDYYPGQGGKVEQLFHDLGRQDDVRVMDQVESDWLVSRFGKLLEGGKRTR